MERQFLYCIYVTVFTLILLFIFPSVSHAQGMSSDSESTKFPFEVTSEIHSDDMVTQSVGVEKSTTPEAREKNATEFGKSYIAPRYKTFQEAELTAEERGMGVLYIVETGMSDYYESEQEAVADRFDRALGTPYRIRTKIQKKAASRGYK
ncbi:MAG: hypothetical protein WCV56_08590 [Candidatus Omnitrophota bacterium]